MPRHVSLTRLLIIKETDEHAKLFRLLLNFPVLHLKCEPIRSYFQMNGAVRLPFTESMSTSSILWDR
jgi:hypothetical protein